MATTQTSLPSYREPPFDANGNWSRSWWRFFESISKTIGGGNVPDLSTIIAAISLLREQIQEQALTPSDISAQLALARVQELDEWIQGQSRGPDLSQYVLLQTLQNMLAAYAPLDSPAFINTPSAPTAALATNTAQLATTAFVQARFGSPPAIGATTPGSGAFTTISATGAITPNQTAGIVGTTTNNSANAGSVGEYAENATVTGLTNGTQANVTSVPLSAGEWDVDGNIEYVPAAGTSIGICVTGISQTSGSVPATPRKTINAFTAGAGKGQSQLAFTTRILLAAPATVYLVGYCEFTGGTLSASGIIRARRPR